MGLILKLTYINRIRNIHIHIFLNKYEYLITKLLFCHLHPLPANDDPLDLSCSLVNLVNLGVPHQLLNWVLSVEAISSEHLDGISGTLVSHVSGKALGNGCHVGVPDLVV